MNLTITGHHIEVTQALDDYVRSKLEQRVLHYFDHVISVHAVLSVAKLKQSAEITVHIKGKDIHAVADDTDLYAAIDAVSDKLVRQVLKYKEKHSQHQHDKRAIA